jgi:hypothetical protein
MQFKLWLENYRKIPYILEKLAAEAKKAGSFENFEHDFLRQIKHGIYWHWTNNPNFQIDTKTGPRDMSSIASGDIDVGKLMITSDLHYWSLYGPKGKGRKFAALIDMSEVPRESYYQVNRGFGNEFFVNDPSKAKVVKILERSKAFDFDRRQNKYLPQSEKELENFYNSIVYQS